MHNRLANPGSATAGSSSRPACTQLMTVDHLLLDETTLSASQTLEVLASISRDNITCFKVTKDDI